METGGVLHEPRVREFLAAREIRPEDLHMVEKLASFPKDLVIMELHNMFNMYKERSGKELEHLLKTSQDETKKALYASALEFYDAYGWPASYNLVRVLEDR